MAILIKYTFSYLIFSLLNLLYICYINKKILNSNCNMKSTTKIIHGKFRLLFLIVRALQEKCLETILRKLPNPAFFYYYVISFVFRPFFVHLNHAFGQTMVFARCFPAFQSNIFLETCRCCNANLITPHQWIIGLVKFSTKF